MVFFYFFYIPIFLVIIVFIGQTLLDRKVARIMQTKSEFQILASSDLLTNISQKTKHNLIFNEKSCFWGNIEDSSNRKYLINRSKTWLKKSLYFNLVAGIGYIVFPFIILSINQDLENSKSEYYYLGLIFILNHFFRYQTFVNEITLEEKKGRNYFGLILRWSYGFIGFLVNLIVKLLPKSNYIYPMLFSLFFICLAFDTMYYHAETRIGIIIAFAFHIYLEARLYKWVKSLDNYKLLILRVFNLDSSTKFTFDEIWKYWRYFGSYLTVVDKSLLNLQKRKLWTNLIVIYFLIILISTLLLGLLVAFGIESQEKRNLILLLLYVIALGIYYTTTFKKINQSFISNQKDLDYYIQQIKKRSINLYLSTFKGYAVRCFDDTWKYVVSEFVEFADVILMDLRGYSESRKGCQQEVNHLLNLVPISKITFLVGEEDLSIVKKLVDEVCQSINVSSPNYNNEDIQVNLYVMIGVKKVQYLNTQGLIDELISSLSISANTA